LLDQGGPKADLTMISTVLQSLADSLYIGPFRNAVNIGTQASYYDLQIGQSFISQWRELQTGAIRAQNEATQALTKNIRRIFGLDELVINPTSQNETLQLIIDGQSRRLNEVGAGLAQFVVCLANATRRPAWILIDEPELNLHPRLQGDFLTALGGFAREGVVYATHSLGLARAQAQRVYSVRQIRHGESEVVQYSATPRLAEFLGELGYASLREIGYDRILLIEGPNDIHTIKLMLRWYGKEHSTVLMPLGGGQSIRDISPAELAEVLQITDRVSVLIDSEKATEDAPLDSGRAAFLAACDAANIPCTVLKRRAIENYLADAAVKKVHGENYKALEPYEKLKDLKLGWPKSANWRIVDAMSKADLADTDLGAFFETL
jgi:energy-coupling factor transporter ATP-binding protein EcfA2